MTTDVAFAQAFQQQKALQYDNNIYFVVYILFQMSLQMIQLVISVINIGREWKHVQRNKGMTYTMKYTHVGGPKLDTVSLLAKSF